jgi:hypothetical protein
VDSTEAIIERFISAIQSNDEETAKRCTVALATQVIDDLHRLADAVEKLSNR